MIGKNPYFRVTTPETSHTRRSGRDLSVQRNESQTFCISDLTMQEMAVIRDHLDKLLAEERWYVATVMVPEEEDKYFLFGLIPEHSREDFEDEFAEKYDSSWQIIWTTVNPPESLGTDQIVAD